MSEALEKQKAEEFEKVFGFLPEEEVSSDPQGVIIVQKVLDSYARTMTDSKESFSKYAENVNVSDEAALKTLVGMRNVVRCAEADYRRAEFIAREARYLGF